MSKKWLEVKRVYTDDPSGFTIWYEYDENGNLINEKDSEGYIKKFKYDGNNNLIKRLKYCDKGISNGYSEVIDDHDKIIKKYHKQETVYDYTDDGLIAHYKDLGEPDEVNRVKMEEWYEYDDNGNIIYNKHITTSYRDTVKFDNETDSFENEPEVTTVEMWTVYSDSTLNVEERLENLKIASGNGDIFSYGKTLDVIAEKLEYDYKGNLLLREDSDGSVRRYKYDENDNAISCSGNVTNYTSKFVSMEDYLKDNFADRA